MKHCFIPRKFSPESSDMIEKIMSILETYREQGYDLSLRQLYYQLVAGNLIPEERTFMSVNGKWIRSPKGSINAEPNYKWIGDIVSDARLAGLIDWDIIQDRGRVVVTPAHWKSPKDIVEAAAQGFRINKWEGQRNHVEVMVEKQALEGVLIPVCEELDVSFTANKGYSSSSALYEAGERLYDAMREDRFPHIIYLGDHDPSGIDMSRDILERLRMFTHYTEGDEQCVTVHRIALNMEQIKVLRPPENPAKITDSRAASYIERFGESSWELDAIEPKKLAALLRQKVHALRDQKLWDKAVARESAMRAELRSFADKSKFK